jgi:hypothetical protein
MLRAVEARVATDPLIGAVLADRYRIIAPIGRGGAGAVYRALQLQLERQVAVKVVRPDVPEATRAELQARFFREASLAARLSHPAIVQTIDYGETDQGVQFVAMELLVGRTLKDALKSGPLPGLEVARIGSELARGLHHAHGKGLIHRDVKASNVLLVRDDEGVEHPKLLDFGLVKSVSRELDVTQTPTYLGTPLYMSPEQARGAQDLDGRTDQYSLGCLLYSLACGVLPFVGESPMATALMHLSEDYPPMRSRVPDLAVDPGLEDIVRRAMSRDPAGRFPDAGALARALDDWTARALAGPAAAPGREHARFALLGAAGALGVVAVAVVAVVGVAGVAAGALWYAMTPVVSLGDGADGPVVAASDPGHDPAADEGSPVEPPALDPPPADPGPSAAPVQGLPAAAPPPRTGASAPRRSPAPEPAVSPEPIAAPIAAPTSAGYSDPGAATESDLLAAPVVVDEVSFTRRSEMAAVLRLANRATREELEAAGITGQRIEDLIGGRPYASVQKLGYTRGVGPDTMRKLHAAANGPR